MFSGWSHAKNTQKKTATATSMITLILHSVWWSGTSSSDVCLLVISAFCSAVSSSCFSMPQIHLITVLHHARLGSESPGKTKPLYHTILLTVASLRTCHYKRLVIRYTRAHRFVLWSGHSWQHAVELSNDIQYAYRSPCYGEIAVSYRPRAVVSLKIFVYAYSWMSQYRVSLERDSAAMSTIKILLVLFNVSIINMHKLMEAIIPIVWFVAVAMASVKLRQWIH